MMKKWLAIVLLFAELAQSSTIVRAQGLKAVRPLDGYSCMVPNLTEYQMTHDLNGPAIRQQPAMTAPSIGQVASQVIVFNPILVENGYTKVLTLYGQPGWVLSNELKPYRSVSQPSSRCIPSLMSNGRPGFAFTH